MKILRTIAEVRAHRASLRKTTKVGLIPTMGSLHEGHLRLIDASHKRDKNLETWASIFVNPAQFAPHEDFSKYPRDEAKDFALLEARGTKAVFAPLNPMELYPAAKPNQTSLGVTRTIVVPQGVEDDRAEGRTRPGHFTGVATIVSKLFNIVQPTRAYFGAKDGLQCIVIRQLVRELNFPIDVRICNTIREPDGLAMSSRNVYLNKQQRAVAPVLYQALSLVRQLHEQGTRDSAELIKAARAVLKSKAELNEMSRFEIQYVSIVDLDTGIEVQGPVPESGFMCSAAINFGNCRILDNIRVGPGIEKN